MTHVRAVFVDLDDTFLAPDKSIPTPNLQLMDDLAARQIELVPCTGRHVNGVPEAMRTHPCVRHVVASNGGIIYDRRADEVIRLAPIDKDVVAALYAQLAGLPIVFDAFADAKAYSEEARRPLYDQIDVPEGLRRYLKEGRTFVDARIPDLLGSIGPVTKLSLFFVDAKGAAAIAAAVEKAGGLVMVQTSAACYEVTNAEATKGAALTWLAAHEGWDIAETVAFGDNNNDVTMIEAAGDGVVMENGEPQVKALADHIAPPAAEGGVALYLHALLDGWGPARPGPRTTSG